MKINTTFSNQKTFELRFDDVVKAVTQLEAGEPVKLLERIELCKKHWEQLKKEVPLRESCQELSPLFGVRVIVRPYLKKARLYYRKKELK